MLDAAKNAVEALKAYAEANEHGEIDASLADQMADAIEQMLQAASQRSVAVAEMFDACLAWLEEDRCPDGADRQLEVAEQATGCAGAGGYVAYAKEQGYEFIEVVDWSSSAGDWAFLVSTDGETWFMMWQENNYPRPGFSYSVDEDRAWYGSAAEVLELI